MTSVTIQFARAAHALTTASRAAGLRAPTFCSPPRRADALRTIRRRTDGQAVIAVRIRGRAFADIAADMADGVCAANGIRGEARLRLRAVLLDALGVADGGEAVAAVASGDPARMAERQTQAA